MLVACTMIAAPIALAVAVIAAGARRETFPVDSSKSRSGSPITIDKVTGAAA